MQETWKEGYVVEQPTDDGYNGVIESDGIRYQVPKSQGKGLKYGDKVEFVAAEKKYRKKLWTKKVIFKI